MLRLLHGTWLLLFALLRFTTLETHTTIQDTLVCLLRLCSHSSVCVCVCLASSVCVCHASILSLDTPSRFARAFRGLRRREQQEMSRHTRRRRNSAGGDHLTTRCGVCVSRFQHLLIMVPCLAPRFLRVSPHSMSLVYHLCLPSHLTPCLLLYHLCRDYHPTAYHLCLSLF